MTRTQQETELQAIAKKILAYKQAEDLSLSQLIETLPEVGSDKTLNKIARGDFSELNFEQWLGKYRAAAMKIDADDSDDLVNAPKTVTIPILDNLTPTLKLRQLFMRLRKNEGENCRLGVLCVDGGGGKTTAAKALQARWKSQVLRIECLIVWDDKPACMLFDLCAALGIKDIPTSRHQRYCKVRDALITGKARRCLIFDEAHYMGPNCLSCLVGLINETPGEFIFLCKPLLWKKLERTAFEACDQLKVNRLEELVKLTEMPSKDYERYLIARLPHLENDREPLAEVVREITRQARDCGHLAFARDVVKRAQQLTKTTEPSDVTTDHVLAAVEEVARKLGK